VSLLSAPASAVNTGTSWAKPAGPVVGAVARRRPRVRPAPQWPRCRGMPRGGVPALPDPGNIPAESVGSRLGGLPSPHPGAACRHGPRRRWPGQGRPKAGPQDREAPLRRTASDAGSAAWPRQRPVRGRVQGPGRGAKGEAVPTPVSCPGKAGQRTASADRVFAFAWVAAAWWCRWCWCVGSLLASSWLAGGAAGSCSSLRLVLLRVARACQLRGECHAVGLGEASAVAGAGAKRW